MSIDKLSNGAKVHQKYQGADQPFNENAGLERLLRESNISLTYFCYLYKHISLLALQYWSSFYMFTSLLMKISLTPKILKL